MRYGMFGLAISFLVAACGGDDAAVDLDAALGADAEVAPDAGPPDATPPSGLGVACSDGLTCASGFCADGVCCDSACDAGCQTCGGNGACGLATAGEECDAFTCTGTAAACPATCAINTECADGAACVAGACVFAKWAFTTSTTRNGNLGGIPGGDAMCQGLADTAGLGGTYKAWLANDTLAPADTFTHATVAYVMPAPGPTAIQLADDWTDLTDGTIDAFFDHTETGGAVPGNIPYTNVMHTGVKASDNGDCADWTAGSNAVSGVSGQSTTTDMFWSNATSTLCNVLHRLYCFEQ